MSMLLSHQCHDHERLAYLLTAGQQDAIFQLPMNLSFVHLILLSNVDSTNYENILYKCAQYYYY